MLFTFHTVLWPKLLFSISFKILLLWFLIRTTQVLYPCSLYCSSDFLHIRFKLFSHFPHLLPTSFSLSLLSFSLSSSSGLRKQFFFQFSLVPFQKGAFAGDYERPAEAYGLWNNFAFALLINNDIKGWLYQVLCGRKAMHANALWGA